MDSTTIDLRAAIGFDPETCVSLPPAPELLDFINLQLASLGEPPVPTDGSASWSAVGQSLMAHFQAKDQLREELRPPVDRRIQDFIHRYLAGVEGADAIRLPGRTLILSQHGIARTLSLPPDSDEFKSDIISSYRVANGALHNPAKDRRTTKGVFHVVEGGLPIPEDKKAVPAVTFAKLLEVALNPPESLLELPVTANQPVRAQAWLSLLLRPIVAPEVPGYRPEKRMEVRFFAPGNMASNLDFVESIFGNAGDPYLRENDAGLDVENWSGHTGAVILAPQMIGVTKKAVGLPHLSVATARQKRDGMCWEKEDELYNDGGAFKLTARDETGCVVTLIADNYFGYCKKEVKTQIGFAANLMGWSEEEHAGGALAFAAYDLGEEFRVREVMAEEPGSFARLLGAWGDALEIQPEGYAVDRAHPQVLYIPEGARFSLTEQQIFWEADGDERSIKLLAGKVYFTPNGYRVELKKPGHGRRWRLIGTVPVGTVCHKPSTVSGGGKSEIAKSIADAIIQAPCYVDDLKAATARVEEVINHNYGDRFKDPAKNRQDSRPILSADRSLGSVIKLLTPREEFNDAHNAFIRSIPADVKELVFIVKRFHKPSWQIPWQERFSVDIINGRPGHELKYRNNPVVSSYLRVGYEADGYWRVFGLRKDFSPAAKIQFEDDITASVVAPRESVGALDSNSVEPSVKLIANCEYRFFQRPDDAIVRGYDHKAEADLARAGTFFSNYQQLTRAEAREIVDDAVRFDYFTAPMKQRIADFAAQADDAEPKYVVCSAFPRIVDGKPTKNPRYLQTRGDLEDPLSPYLARTGARLHRGLGASDPVNFPVNAVLCGRRNNGPDGPIRNLAVFNPIHYLPLPEAFMEFTSSMTGKSPSTTGAGSEGALTKGPFNAVLPIHDLNNALVSFIVTGYAPFITAAGCVGPNFRVDHDISLLVPEVFSRMRPEERDPANLIASGCLEKVEDFAWQGQTYPASLLGYRITDTFVSNFLGRIFITPNALFTEAMIKPELQGEQVYADGIENILATHEKVAKNYFADGSIDYACPPLKALLHIMRDGHYQGKTLADAEVRGLFERETVLSSDWYAARLQSQQASDVSHLRRLENYLGSFGEDFSGLATKKTWVQDRLARVVAGDYLTSLHGTIGRDPHLAIP